MRRIGRSKNNTLALITQSVHDAENDDDTTGLEQSLPSMKNQNAKIFYGMSTLK